MKAKSTAEYIKTYLTPSAKSVWMPWVGLHHKVKEVIYFHYPVNHDLICESILGLDYGDFLKTPYWAVISEHCLELAGNRCQVCGAEHDLNVHHKTFSRHGCEHLPCVLKEDLIVLCGRCHRVHQELGFIENKQKAVEGPPPKKHK